MKTLIAACMLVPLLFACGKKQEAPTPAPAAKTESAAPTPAPSAEEALNAVSRGHPGSTKVCYDPIHGYFVHYKDQPAGEAADNLFHGWYLIKTLKFNKSSNNTWFIADYPNSDYALVYPEVTGLSCKDQ